MRRDRILGVPFDSVTMDEALAKTERFVRGKGSHLIVHLSLPLVLMARRNRAIRMLLEEADLIVPTGKRIFWAARFLKRAVGDSIDPSILVKRLMIQSADLGKKVYLFGGKGYTVDMAYENLKKEITRLFVIGRYRGNYRKQEHERIVTAIGKASPDYFFVGLGSPQEEQWVIANRKRTNAKLIVLIENLFDLFAGRIGKLVPVYAGGFDFEKLMKREIPHPHSMKMFVLVPVFVISVLFERMFRKPRT